MTGTIARQIVLASRPSGPVGAENFRLEEAEIPACPPGGVLLRSLVLLPAEIVGYGPSSDAYHMAAAPPDGAGAQRALRAALTMADIRPEQIGHINAHATSTPVGDAGELAAIRAVYGARRPGPAISSTKGATGHLLGAAGGLEAIFSVLALRDGTLPPTLNLIDPDSAAEGLDLIGSAPRKAPIDLALSNGFGFGGVNATVILRKLH